MRRVRPSDPGWPKPREWATLREAVGGNLIEPHALFAACETAPGGTACVDVEKSILNPFYVGDQPAGTTTSGWLDAWKAAPSAWSVTPYAKTALHAVRRGGLSRTGASSSAANSAKTMHTTAK